MADVVGIGVDAVDVDRFRRALARTPTLAERVFTAGELLYARRRPDPTQPLAARFAAKEAVMKCMGVGLGACAAQEIEVVRAESGAPSIVLHGKAASLASERGIATWMLSLTHTDISAVAMAVALRG
jgi:holo-[acyl-carrier protein] synthase